MVDAMEEAEEEEAADAANAVDTGPCLEDSVSRSDIEIITNFSLIKKLMG